MIKAFKPEVFEDEHMWISKIIRHGFHIWLHAIKPSEPKCTHQRDDIVWTMVHPHQKGILQRDEIEEGRK